MAYRKHIPQPSEQSKPFWDAVKNRQLTVQRCPSCGHLRFPFTFICPKCLAETWEWQPVSGEGTVYSWNVMHRAPGPGFEEDLPYPVLLVELKEGPKLFSAVVDCTADQLRIGMPVKVVFEDITDDFALYKFRPA